MQKRCMFPWNSTPVFYCGVLLLKLGGSRSFAASSGLNSGSKHSRVVEQRAVSIGVRDDVPRLFRERLNVLRQQHHTTSSSYANPRRISSNTVLWKERCRGHADGSGSPRRAFVFTRALHLPAEQWSLLKKENRTWLFTFF